MIEQKLFGIDQSPNDILIGSLGIIFVLVDVGRRNLQFLLNRVSGKGNVVELGQPFYMVPFFVIRERRRTSVSGRQLALNFFRIQKMQTLSQVGFA